MKTALGKGLHSLIPPREDKKNEILDAIPEHSIIKELKIEEVRPQHYQPRQNFDEDKLQELMASIKEQGLIQPIIVKKGHDGKYDLIAGERRYRAVKALGIARIPAIVKDVTDEKMLEIAIIENIQREDLNPIEEAVSFEHLIAKYNLTQEDVAKKVGKDRATITNALRLLKLPDIIKEMVVNNEISQGHARTLLGVPYIEKQIAIAYEIVEKGLSVRQVEALIKSLENIKKTNKKNIELEDLEIKELQNNLQKFFGTKVNFKSRGKKGTIEINYFSIDDLNRILEVMGYKT